MGGDPLSHSQVETCTSLKKTVRSLLWNNRYGRSDVGVESVTDRMNQYGIHTNPVLIPGTSRITVQRIPHVQRYLDRRETGKNCCNDASSILSARASESSARIIVTEGHISGVVGVPNACCSQYLPTAEYLLSEPSRSEFTLWVSTAIIGGISICPQCSCQAKRIFTLFGVRRTTGTVRTLRTIEDQRSHEPVVTGSKQGRAVHHQDEASRPWVLGS